MKIGFNLIAGIWFFLACGSVVVVAQGKTEEPIKTTLCQIVKTPDQFNGKLVQVRRKILVGFEGSVIYNDCPANIWLSWSDKPRESEDLEYAPITAYADVKAPSLLHWEAVTPRNPITLHEDGAYRQLSRLLRKKARTPKGIQCIDCFMYEVTATITGRFDHSSGTSMAIRGTDRKISISSGGFGHMNGWPSQLVMQSVANVVAVRIDRAAPGKGK